MPVGFESVNAFGSTQLTNDGLYLFLRRSGKLQSGWTCGMSGLFHRSFCSTTLTLPVGLASAPVLAISSPVGSCWAALMPAQSGPASCTWRISADELGAAYLAVEYFLFTNEPPPPNGSLTGLELFNPPHGLVYASDQYLIRPLGMLGDVYAGDDVSGKKIAFVPIKTSSYSSGGIYLADEGEGVCGGSWYGYSYRVRESVEHGGVCTDATGVSFGYMYEWYDNPWSCETTEYPGSDTWRYSGAEQALIIDVTGVPVPY